ncbi:hypothetical protein [Synechococcus sp. BA-132 BA5]|uniref:hypothetical protein n=1 Tax=Synechococcus sp. BA-132 BA5 TaxID=3110252 RepID=UPI002B20AAE6|nr:hypothetical protein [Synechococcus sp. BA-132 BA5]MEA5414909.1 hypothetical protein [Synechococcus sp. BA-132 BA5]
MTNCQRVSQVVTDNSAPVRDALETLARQRYGRALSELSPTKVMALAMAATVEGRPMTAVQRLMEERCAAHQQRLMAKQSAAAGICSLFGAQGFLDRWGRERLAGLGCGCVGFRPAGEDVEQRCESRVVCPGQLGDPRVPDPERGCAALSRRP